MAADAAEKAVAEFLRVLRDPSTVVDQAAVKSLEAKLEKATDAVERLKLRAQLRRELGGEQRFQQITQNFIDMAKQWADANDVEAEAFVEEGVPRDVLERAKLISRGDRRRSTGGSAGRRSARVSDQDLRNAINGLKKFTARQAAEAAGLTSPARVSALLQAAMAQDPPAIEAVGPDPDHAGRGRAPMVYRRVRKL